VSRARRLPPLLDVLLFEEWRRARVVARSRTTGRYTVKLVEPCPPYGVDERIVVSHGEWRRVQP